MPRQEQQDDDPGWLVNSAADEPWPGDEMGTDDSYASISEKEKSAAHSERFGRYAATALLSLALLAIILSGLVILVEFVFFLAGVL